MEQRQGDLFEDFEPEMTLKEAGALLGVSDHTAMLAEKSATRKLRSIFEAMGTSSLRDFISMTDEEIDHTLATFAAEDCQYSERYGWYELSSATSLNGGIESLKDIAVAYALLRVQQANRFRVPLLYRPTRDFPYSAIGSVEAVSRFGERTLFRSTALRKKLKADRQRRVGSIAVVESEIGEDRYGAFEIPIILAVLGTGQEDLT